MKISKIIVLLYICLTSTLYAKPTLKVFTGSDNVAPYDLNSSGFVLANSNRLVLGQLLKPSSDFKLQPGLLDTFYYDFKTDQYILKLKNGIMFHNGRKATSKDLEFSLTRGFYSPKTSYFHTYLGNIVGAKDLPKNIKFKSGALSGVKIIDDLTVSVKLIGPNPTFLHVLTNPYFSLVPIEELKDDYLSWKNIPIGAGDYKVLSGYDGEKTVFVEDKKTTKFHKIIFYTKKIKGLDISFESDKMLKAVYSDRPMNTRLFAFSNQNKLGRNFKFKTIVKNLVDKINLGNAKFTDKSNTLLPKHFWGQEEHHQALSDKDLKTLIEKLKLKKIDAFVYSGPKLSEKHMFYINKIKSIFKSFGIQINFTPNSEKFPSLETSKKYSIGFWGILTHYVDPLIMYSSYRNIGHNTYFCTSGDVAKKYEKLYEGAEKAKTFDERLNWVRKINKFSQEKIIQVPIAAEKMVYYINSKRIKTLGNQPSPLMLDFSEIIMND